MKRVCSIWLGLALGLSLLVGTAGAVQDPNARLAEIDAQIAALEAELAPLKEQADANAVNEIYLVAGTIVQTSPQFIVQGGGFSLESLLGGGTPYYIVENPQDGVTSFGTYTGRHSIGDRVTIQLGNLTCTATKVGPLPAETVALDERIAKLKDQMEQLNTERKQVEAQIELPKEQYQNALMQYNTDSETNILFQIGNPYVVAYGNVAMIEEGNWNACPVIVNDYTMVPATAVMDAIGGDTGWNQEAQEVDLTFINTTIVLHINDSVAVVNGTPVTMTIAPQIIGGKTMIPLGFVSKTMGLQVEWIPQDSVIRMVYSNDWTDHMDQYVADNGNGTKHYYDSELGIQYDVPSSCVIEATGSAGSDDSTTITVAGTNGTIKVSRVPEYITPYGDLVSLTQQQVTNGIRAIYFSENRDVSSTAMYVVDAGLADGTRIKFEITAQSDTVIWDVSDPTLDLTQAERESAKHLNTLEEIVRQILNTLEGTSLG